MLTEFTCAIVDPSPSDHCKSTRLRVGGYVCFWVGSLWYAESVERHERHFSRQPQSVHGRQNLGTRLVCVHDVVKQPLTAQIDQLQRDSNQQI